MTVNDLEILPTIHGHMKQGDQGDKNWNAWTRTPHLNFFFEYELIILMKL